MAIKEKPHTSPSLFFLILQQRIHYPECFHPTRHFYKTTQIRQKRFGQLLRGEKNPEEIEIKNFCNYIGCDNYELFVARQLNIPFIH